MDIFRSGEIDAVDEIMVADYVQHDPDLETGRQAFKDHFRRLGPIDVKVHRMIAEGDFVVVHLQAEQLNLAAIDIFRLDSRGMIIEHWHVIQQIPSTTASGHDMFSQLT